MAIVAALEPLLSASSLSFCFANAHYLLRRKIEAKTVRQKQDFLRMRAPLPLAGGVGSGPSKRKSLKLRLGWDSLQPTYPGGDSQPVTSTSRVAGQRDG
jgi:hypothetical protein